MNYETEIINGHKAIVHHIFKPHQIQPNSRWCAASGSNHIVTVEKVVSYPASDHEENHWYVVHYFWEENGVKKTHNKDTFSFQVRYCKIVEDEE
jgi:hypothetical protein